MSDAGEAAPTPALTDEEQRELTAAMYHVAMYGDRGNASGLRKEIADILAGWSASPPTGQAPTTARKGRALPHPGSPEASAMMDSLLAEYQYPANSKNAARAGWEAANRWLAGQALPAPSVEELPPLPEPTKIRKTAQVRTVHDFEADTVTIVPVSPAPDLYTAGQMREYALAAIRQAAQRLTAPEPVGEIIERDGYGPRTPLRWPPAAPAGLADAKDAARYRWWREYAMQTDDVSADDAFLDCEKPEDVDAVIDAAIQGQQ